MLSELMGPGRSFSYPQVCCLQVGYFLWQFWWRLASLIIAEEDRWRSSSRVIASQPDPAC